MKPYIIDDRDIVTANVKCIIFYTTLFAIMYKGWLEYNNTSVKIYRTKKLNNGSRVTGSAI